mmetsp:Transcript_40922/g.73767  ORF Transcript_40922/g.73767 Transcript_40922/m.73767 type:complete len:432 (+) Transcript_40922:155-1450(+)|eukprot:CAMPEP_0201882738 /NCGR_PEP_ID=MMETSP0902-20130614/14372_1 /ASSEMBLY_ACC=CAM_ASM_000551 /TAXON_ID=420261 /ORGANISM="Thalassiosira antarctica, Strain CCMP982" /LENGTH=431 /DNA_ID=CAMNT_0048411327 /DNA_START=102 /DNA_END=1397 /DNA_ORIENTATION=-
MKLSLCLLAAITTHQQLHHAEAFSLQMQSSRTDIPPPLRSVASPPPSSTSSSLRSPPPKSVLSLRLATTASATIESPTPSASTPHKTKTLGLLTFDLDDSLYPIAPVLHDANEIFVQTMLNYGYALEPNDIVESGKRIREEAGPIAGTAMSHTEVRLEAIRREMERKMLEKKLQECAEDWATEVESLTAPIRNSAAKWAKSAVSQTVVESIYSAWERERHHSAERHLYPEILSSLQQIREKYPDVVIGAVTDGKANPMLMVFSLAPYFDFCMSWEDDASGRTEFFKELGNVDGNADLQWIYRAAYEKYTEIAETKREMTRSLGEEEVEEESENDTPLWIHVGDDLAYDVGGSASCGAKTILLDLDEEYGQTAKVRFDLDGPEARMPSWNTASEEEITNRKAMNDAAESVVDKRVSRLSMLPDAIDDILKGE